MVDKYNTTYHRSIKLSPSDARNPSNYKHVFTALYGKIRPLPPLAKFHVGENVRIVRKKDTFEKGVKWKGYSNAFNSWMPEADLEA